MGLGQNSGRGTFVNIRKGVLTIKKGDVIEEYGNLSGQLTGIDIQDDKFPNSDDTYRKLALTIVDGSDHFILQMKMGSGYANGLCMALPNADLSLPITFIPSLKVVDGKDKATMFLSQQKPGQKAQSLKWYWTKDNPGNLPRLDKITYKGKEVWDNTKQQAYLEEVLLLHIKPKLETPPHALMAGGNSDLKTRTDWRDPAADITWPLNDSDLPF